MLDAFLVAAAERGHDKLEVEDALSGALRKRGVEAGASAGAKASALLPDIEPWPEPVEGAEILKRITDDLSTYVSMSPEQKVACAVWSRRHAFDGHAPG